MARSIIASYGMHAMNLFASLGIFMLQGHRMQRQQNPYNNNVYQNEQCTVHVAVNFYLRSFLFFFCLWVW